MAPQDIVSPSNPLLKTIRRLARTGRREPVVLLEGVKLVETAIEEGVELEALVLSSDLAEERRARFDELATHRVSSRVFRELTSLASPEGILALMARPARPLRDLEPTESCVVVAAGIQDPGNLGALARVAEAAGASALVVSKGSADPFGPKTLRGSMGSLLRLPVFEIEHPRTLRDRGFRLAALVPRGGTSYRDADLRAPLALLFGSESRGLDDDVLALAELQVSIPMRGRVESLNVAAAAALVLYEAARR